MTARIALCIDELTRLNPEIIGLPGERLESQHWLELYESGTIARNALMDNASIDEIWVASCDDVESINLAATLKADCVQRKVRLLGLHGGGSLLSRAHTANIDEVMSQATFVERYSLEKGLAKAQSAETSKTSMISSSPTVAAIEEESSPATQASLLPALATLHASCFVMPVVSGSGGAGKSTVATLSAFCSHAIGRKTLLLDYDLQFGDLAVMSGIENPLTLDEALVRPDKLEAEITRTDRPALIAAPPRLEMAESLSRAVPELLERLAPSFDVIVANTGAAWAEQHAALIERSSSVLFLVDQRASSVRACRHALELCARCGIATGQFRFLLNRCGKGAPLTAADVSCALHGTPVAELRDGGRDVEEHLAAGAVVELAESENPLYASVRSLMADLLPSIGPAISEQAIASTQGRALGRRRGRHVGKRKGWGR